MFLARSLLASGALGVLALGGLVAFDANAQQIYRIVGSDGRVTFSDQPPLQPGGIWVHAVSVGERRSRVIHRCRCRLSRASAQGGAP